MTASISPASATSRPTRVRYGVLGFCSLLATITYLDRVCFGTVAPNIQSEFGLSNSQLGWLFTAFAFAYAIFEVPTGWMGDYFGARRTLIRIVLWWSVFTALTGLIYPSIGVFAFGTLLAVRFLFWQPNLALRRLDIGVMYLGYLAIVVQLVVHFLGVIMRGEWVGTVSVHLFTFGAMGLIIPAMLMRISKGHTGRKVVFDRGDKLVLWIMMLGFAARIVAPQLYPAGYAKWIYLSAACWFFCFATLAWRYIPFLVQPRVDGKEH